MKNTASPTGTRDQLAAARRSLQAEAQRRGVSLPDVLRERIRALQPRVGTGPQRGEGVTRR
jgi:hypothetical protein